MGSSDKLRSTTFSAGPNAVLPAFEAYQAARVEFAQEVAKLALPDDPLAPNAAAAPGGTYEVDGPEKVLATLEASYNLLPDMRPLVNDQSAAVRENALLAMGRLSNLSTKLQEQISEEDTLAATVATIAAGASPSLLKAALFMLHSSVKPSIHVATLAVERNALPALCERLEDSDSAIKAAAVWCLGAIANHEAGLAAAVVDSGALQLLMQSLKVSKTRTCAREHARAYSHCTPSGSHCVTPAPSSTSSPPRPPLSLSLVLRGPSRSTGAIAPSAARGPGLPGLHRQA